MKEYVFTCPLAGCGQALSVHADSLEQGQTLLVVEAKQHLATVHPDIHKTSEQVQADIAEHMQQV